MAMTTAGTINVKNETKRKKNKNNNDNKKTMLLRPNCLTPRTRCWDCV